MYKNALRYRTGAEKLMDISDVAYSTWFKSLRLDRMEDGRLFIIVADELSEDYMNKKYIDKDSS